MIPTQTALGSGAVITSILWFVALVTVAIVVWRERKGSPLARFPFTDFVLKRFHINEQHVTEPVIEITGRAAGAVSWLFAVLRLEPDHRFVVTASYASMQYASLSGFFHVFMPLEKISTTFCGYKRSILALALAMLSAFGFLINLLSAFIERNDTNEFQSDLAWSFGCLILAAIFAAVFFLTKRIAVKLSSAMILWVSCSRQA